MATHLVSAVSQGFPGIIIPAWGPKPQPALSSPGPSSPATDRGKEFFLEFSCQNVPLGRVVIKVSDAPHGAADLWKFRPPPPTHAQSPKVFECLQVTPSSLPSLRQFSLLQVLGGAGLAGKEFECLVTGRNGYGYKGSRVYACCKDEWCLLGDMLFQNPPRPNLITTDWDPRSPHGQQEEEAAAESSKFRKLYRGCSRGMRAMVSFLCVC